MLADREIQAEKDRIGSPIIEDTFHINLGARFRRLGILHLKLKDWNHIYFDLRVKIRLGSFIRC